MWKITNAYGDVNILMNAKREIHTPETDKFDDGGDTKAVIGDMVV